MKHPYNNFDVDCSYFMSAFPHFVTFLESVPPPRSCCEAVGAWVRNGNSRPQSRLSLLASGTLARGKGGYSLDSQTKDFV